MGPWGCFSSGVSRARRSAAASRARLRDRTRLWARVSGGIGSDSPGGGLNGRNGWGGCPSGRTGRTCPADMTANATIRRGRNGAARTRGRAHSAAAKSGSEKDRRKAQKDPRRQGQPPCFGRPRQPDTPGERTVSKHLAGSRGIGGRFLQDRPPGRLDSGFH